MSLFESSESTGEVSLEDLFDNQKEIKGTNNLTIENLAYVTCRGGQPHSINIKKKSALEQAFDYFEAIIRSDINRTDNRLKNPECVKRLMKSLARNQGTQIPNTLLKEDIISNESNNINEDSIASYIYALHKIYVIEDMPTWNPNLRSKTAIRISNTRFFNDLSIATASLGLSSKDLVNDLITLGFLFKTFCIRNLKVYAEKLNGDIEIR